MRNGFPRACLLGKFVSLNVLFFNEIEDHRKICLIIFMQKAISSLFCVFVHCLVCQSYMQLDLETFDITVLRPQVAVLKNLFYLKWFSSSNCTAPINVDVQNLLFSYAINLNKAGNIAMVFFSYLTEKIYERICLRKKPDYRKFNFRAKTERNTNMEFITHNN